MKEGEIKTGMLLLAEPFMEDPYFGGAVILLCDEHENGTVGLILNKPLDLKIGDVVPDLAECAFPIGYGGPVEPNVLHFIHRQGGLIADSIPISRGLWMGGDFDEVVFLINQGLITQSDIRFFIGYSGWSVGQLGEELELKSWIASEGDLNFVFDAFEPAFLWHEIMNLKGGHYSVLATMPYDMTWN